MKQTLLQPSCKNLLRRPLVLGVPMPGLVLLTGVVVSIEILGQNNVYASAFAGGLALCGYLSLRILSRFAKPGWEEVPVFWLERRLSRKKGGYLSFTPSRVCVVPPDTLDHDEFERARVELKWSIEELKPGERRTLLGSMGSDGFTLREVAAKAGSVGDSTDWSAISSEALPEKPIAYSLFNLPVVTDPLWLFSQIKRLKGDYQVILSLNGVDAFQIKNRVEGARKRSYHAEGLSNVDNDVTFDESTSVLQGLSRGDETLVELALVVVSAEPLDLDPQSFVKEATPGLALSSALGLRRRGHRTHVVRSVTAVDLFPRYHDAKAGRSSVFRSSRNIPLEFDPQDARLEALHWLVVGASGSGKSFLTGLMLRRLMEGGSRMSVLYLDHNRSFRRMVHRDLGIYLEPEGLQMLERESGRLFNSLEHPGVACGVELSDLPFTERKEASQWLLAEVEAFLRRRQSAHPIYVVFDECWNFLRDEPVMVQRAFREFRKLNGAAIAITQSLTDFIKDESGSSVFQNAPIRILLRQGEDLAPYRGVLSLNDVELGRLKTLRQERGHFSECLIKTPYLSRIARLYPTSEEHELLRTDNLREELIAATRSSLTVTAPREDRWKALL